MRTGFRINVKDEMPMEQNVDDIFFDIIPDLPTPEKIIFPYILLLHLQFYQNLYL